MLIGLIGNMGSGKDTFADYLLTFHGFSKLAFADPLKRFCKEIYDFSESQLWGPSEERNKPDNRYPREWSFVCNDCVAKFHPNGVEEKTIGSLMLYRCAYCSSEKERRSDGQYILTFLTPRLALQLLGTEWGRTCYPETWVRYGIDVAKKMQTGMFQYYRTSGLKEREYTSWQRDPRAGPNPRPSSVIFTDARFLNEVQAIREAGGFVVHLVRGQQSSAGIKGHASEEEQKGLPNTVIDVTLHVPEGLEAYGAEISRVMAGLRKRA